MISKRKSDFSSAVRIWSVNETVNKTVSETRLLKNFVSMSCGSRRHSRHERERLEFSRKIRRRVEFSDSENSILGRLCVFDVKHGQKFYQFVITKLLYVHFWWISLWYYFQNSILEKLHRCQRLLKPFLEMIFWNDQGKLFLC